MEDITITAVAPWFSLDAGTQLCKTYAPQSEIDFCLSCPHTECLCDRCDGQGNVRRKKKSGCEKTDLGRCVEHKTEELMELLRLRVCNRQIAETLGVTYRTVSNIKRRLRERGDVF